MPFLVCPRGHPSARTGCHPLVCHLAQLSPPQSVSFFSQAVPVASSSGPLSPLCALYLKLNKLSCNDLFLDLSLPRGEELPGARDCVLVIFIHLSPWFNAPLNPFPKFSELLSVITIVMAQTANFTCVSCLSLIRMNLMLPWAGWALSSLSSLIMSPQLGMNLPKHQTLSWLWVKISSFSRLARSTRPGVPFVFCAFPSTWWNTRYWGHLLACLHYPLDWRILELRAWDSVNICRLWFLQNPCYVSWNFVIIKWNKSVIGR